VFNGLQQDMERVELDITAQLARLELSEEEIQSFEQAVVQMLEYFSKMREFDVGPAEMLHLPTKTPRLCSATPRSWKTVSSSFPTFFN